MLWSLRNLCNWPLADHSVLVSNMRWWICDSLLSLMGGWHSCVSHGNERGGMPNVSQQSPKKKYCLLFSAELLSSPTPTNEMWSVLPLQIHTDVHTWLVKISRLASSQRHNTHQYITHSRLSASSFCSLGLLLLFSFTLFRLRPHVLWRSFEPV